MYRTLKRLMREGNYDSVTVNCLSGILNLVDTTPCLAFMRLRDEGIPAVCEADVPQTMTSLLMRTLARRPTFINDPVLVPERNAMIVAHCTAPTRMAGYDESPEPYDAKLHHETERGLAPSVKLREGQRVTVAGLAHDLGTVVATPGRIVRNTDYHICLTQAEVRIPDAEYLFDHFEGFHWVLVYGDWMNRLEETARLLELDVRVPEQDEIPEESTSGEPLLEDDVIPAHLGREPLGIDELERDAPAGS